MEQEFEVMVGLGIASEYDFPVIGCWDVDIEHLQRCTFCQDCPWGESGCAQS